MKVHSIKEHELLSFMDLGVLIQSPNDLGKVLHVLVEKVARLMRTDACSLYLFNSITEELTLKATYGLNEMAIDQIIIKAGQGLTGTSLKLLKPISIANATKSKIFLPMAGLGEEEYASFLGVPLVYNACPIGVISVQNKKTTKFRKKDVDFLLSLAIPAVSLIEKAKFMETVGTVQKAAVSKATLDKANDEVTYEYLRDHIIKGIPAVPGISMGRLKIISQTYYTTQQDTSTPQNIESEIKKLQESFLHVSHEIRETKKQAEAKFGPDEASIFEAYLLFLESHSFQQQVINEIKKGLSAIKALDSIVKKYMDRMALAHDEYIKERAYDIQDISRKISDYLLYGESSRRNAFTTKENAIFFNDFWSISDFTNLDLKKTKGIISPSGGANSHIAILADTLNIPTVLGLSAIPGQLKNDDNIIVDGYAGVVIVNPTKATIELYKHEIEESQKRIKSFETNKDKKIRIGLKSKHYFPIGANLNMVAHAKNAVTYGADLIGLCRTEFPFLIRKQLPTEEEQFIIYKRVIDVAKDKKVVFRTLDIGGDKYVAYLNLPKESNPSLGWRAIRFSLERKDLFRIQLRAILRASHYGKIKLLFPMITTMEELREAKQILQSVKKELRDEGLPFARHIPIGAMVEVPAAVEIAEHLAKEVDFFSLGTNDLVQYCLAVDRSNPVVAKLYDPYHPAVLKMIQRTITAAHKHKIKVSACGDIAAQPLLCSLLIGMGIDSLSMTPRSIPKIKSLAKLLNMASTIRLAHRCLKMETGVQIRKEVENYFLKNGFDKFLFETRAPISDY
ncbi:MAG: phosphoenolpyruvate--protein phosphotransferase [bacterium]|nr:phosphoenolpyruvate--protein phosphotransferase [bacterium]MBU1916703.1 phosphoenolpyruvate--protein phosphotransferase [bacterium]